MKTKSSRNISCIFILKAFTSDIKEMLKICNKTQNVITFDHQDCVLDPKIRPRGITKIQTYFHE